MEGTRNERVLAVAFSAHSRSGAERAYFQTDFFLRGCSLGNGLMMASGRMRGKGIRFLYRFIEKLDELNKALVLLYLDGNSYAEIAGVLGISETNVATKINRLKNSMKQEFSSRQAG
jgi:phage regulator Rha-like protein